MSRWKCVKKRIYFSAVILAIFLSACASNAPAADNWKNPISSGQDSEDFQEYLWLENPVVLLVQVGIVLAGALGVAALLPSTEEEKGGE